jgi:6,7-dimethyl-8-ribityllumazine synthase
MKTFNVAIVTSRFNEAITEALYHGAHDELVQRGFTADQITSVWVPGAVEIPLTAQRLARTQRYAAIIALGAVIRGDTTHYDYVCEQVSQGCQRIALECDLPVIFGVLTTENEAQAEDRVGGKCGHKGRDAAQAAISMVEILGQIGA